MCNITGKKPSQLDDPQVAVDNTAWLVIETPDGKVVKINPNDLPNLGGTNTYFLDETGGNAPGAPANPATPPAGAGAGDTAIEFYDDKILYWGYNGAAWTLVYTQTLASGGAGSAYETYHAGNGGYVTADGLTVVYTKSAGLGTFAIPANQKMSSFRVMGNAADLNAGELRLVFTGGRGSGTNFNTSNADLYHPIIVVTNRTKVLPADPELQRPDDAGDSIDIFEEAFIAAGQVSVKITGLSGDFEIKGTF